MPSALITGGAGFLGSHLCDRLLSDGWNVTVMDNLITGSPSNLKEHFGDERFRFIQYNVTDYLFVDGPLDIVFHAASPASPVDYLRHPIHTLKVGSLGTHKALGLAHAKGARFLLFSTSEVYGDPDETPQPETYRGSVSTIGERGVYDEAKRFAEAMTMAYNRAHGVDTRIVRIFNTYGERMRRNDGRVIPNLIGQALTGEPMTLYGDGTQTRSFCYVSDLIDGIVRLAESTETMPVNIGNPHEVTMLELADRIRAITGSKAPNHFMPMPTADDPKRRCPDITRARTLLGWQPKVDLDTGLARTIRFFDETRQAA